MQIYTYEDYRQEPGILTLKEMGQMHEEMRKDIGRDEEAMGMYKALLLAAERYVEKRNEWEFLSMSEKMEKDSERTAAHDVLLSKMTLLGRYLRSEGKEAGWFGTLGDEKTRRQTWGDFACYLVMVNAMNAR